MTKTLLLLSTLLVASASCRRPGGAPPPSQPVSKVLDALKTELALLAETRPSQEVKPGVCKGKDGKVFVGLVPTTATLVLKVAVTDVAAGSVGAKIPAGNVVTIDPEASTSRTSVRTQQLTLELGVDHQQSVEELREEARALQGEIEADERQANADPELAQNLRFVDGPKVGRVQQIYREILHQEVVSGEAPGRGAAYSEERFRDHSLADTLWKLREQLLAVDHSKTPCLKPTQLTSQVDFQVVDERRAKTGASFLIVNAGGEAARTDDRTQSLTVTFDMAGSSTTLR